MGGDPEGRVILLACVWLQYLPLPPCNNFLPVIMASNSFAEKDAQLTTYAPENLPAHNNFSPLSPFYNVYNRFARWRAALDLPQPGAIENLQKEVKGIALSVPWSSFAQL